MDNGNYQWDCHQGIDRGDNENDDENEDHDANPLHEGFILFQ